MKLKSWELLVFGEPKGQPRPRAFARHMGGGKFVARVYESGTAEAYKSAIAAAAKEVDLAGADLQGPINLHVVCWFTRPKSHFRTGKRAAELREDAPVWHTKKPDGDNILKAIKDALTQVGAWRDDSQVARESIEKKFTGSSTPTTRIRVSFLEE
jgi:Holliday junction resolvase RusA-like endonuclease